MSKNTHYVIIDHMGSLTKEEITEVYPKATAMAKARGFEKIFTLKNFIELYMPRTRNIDGAKWVVRNQRHPELVLFICPYELTSKVKAGIKAWERPGTEVILVQPSKLRPYVPTPRELEMFFDYGDTDSKRRMIASIWAPALGWSFKHPLYRPQQDEIPDVYMHQSSRYADIDPEKLSKYSSKEETFLESKRCIVSPKELDEFFEFYKAVRTSGIAIEEYLEPDYKICPNCGRPYRAGQGSSVSCPRCDFETEDTEITSYWDDRGEEPAGFAPSYDPYDIGVDLGNFFDIPRGKLKDVPKACLIGSVTCDNEDDWKWLSSWI